MTIGRVAVTYRLDKKAEPYFAALRQADVEPVGVSPAQPVESLDGFDGLLLSGGTDLDPALYGQVPHAKADKPDRERDELELLLVREALARDVPVLAICRGMQLFNVAHRGTLYQDMSGHTKEDGPHKVDLISSSKTAAILGPGPHQVNSRHHQAVDRVGHDLVIAALAGDGIIEALERPGRRFAIAVQWHPEDILHMESQQRLFRSFAEAL